MNIVIIGATTYDSLEFNLHHACIQLGHQCTIIEYFSFKPIPKVYIKYATLASEGFDIGLSKKVLRRINQIKPDLVIGVYRDIHPHLIISLKAQGYLTIHINPDTIATLQRQQIIASSYDYYFTKCPMMAEILKKIGKKVFIFKECFNPSIHKTKYTTKQEAEQSTNIDVLMIGEFYPYRVHFLNALQKQPYSIQCFGYKGRYYPAHLDKYFANLYITGSQKADLLFGAKVVVNNFYFSEINSVNNKFFEIGGVGGVQVIDNKAILSEFYLPNIIPIVSFNSLDEMVEKVEKLLKDDNLRFHISDLNKQVFASYTYTNLIQNILTQIGCN